MKVITVTNQKGGVAKTTTAAALGFGIGQKGYKVLLVDTDAQCNLTDISFPVNEKREVIDQQDIQKSVYDIMTRKEKIKDVILHTQYENVDIVPSSIFLTDIDVQLMSSLRREMILSDALKEVADKYDYVIIDTPPSLSWMTMNALVASDGVIIPTHLEKFSINGIKQLYENIVTIKSTINANLKILGFVVTRNKGRTAVGKSMRVLVEQFAESMKTSLFKATIREQVAINEAQIVGRNIYDYLNNARKTIRGNVADDYRAFVDEVLEKVEVQDK